MTNNKKGKNLLYTVIGGTIVVCIVKPLVDKMWVWSSTTSLKLFSKYQNSLYEDATTFDESIISIRILYYLVIVLCIAAFFLTNRIRGISVSANETIKSFEKEDKQHSSAENGDNVSLVNFKRKIIFMQLLTYVYVAVVVIYLIINFGKLATQNNIKSEYKCKMALVESAGINTEILQLKKQWLKINTKEMKIKFDTNVDSILNKYGIIVNEYCK